MNQIEMFRYIFNRDEPVKPEHAILINSTVTDEVKDEMIYNLIKNFELLKVHHPKIFNTIIKAMDNDSTIDLVFVWIAHTFYGFGYVTGREHEKFIRELGNDK